MTIYRVNRKFLNTLLLITSLIGLLQWGNNDSAFLFQAEAQILMKLFTDPAGAIHPLILLPILGQLLLLISLFQKTPRRILTFAAIGCLGVLLGFMFVIGLLSKHFLITISTVPFITVSWLTLLHYRKNKNDANQISAGN